MRFFFQNFFRPIFLCFLISSCGPQEIRPESKRNNYIVKKKCQTLRPYKIRNSHGEFKVYPKKSLVYDKIGLASYYSAGRLTATAERFNKYAMTAAHPYLPLPVIAEVSLVSNPQKKIIVKINDRGPFTRQKRIIDLSLGAAIRLGIVRQGIAKVRVRTLPKATMKLKEHGGNITWNGVGRFRG